MCKRNNNITIKFKSYSKKVITVMLCITALLSFAACDKAENPSPIKTDVQKEFDAYCNNLFTEYLAQDATNIHFTVSDPSDYGLELKKEDYTLGEASFSQVKETIESMQKNLNSLKKFDRNKLSKSRQITYDTLEDYMETQLLFDGCELLQNTFAPSSGIHSNLAILFTEYNFYEKDDIDQYFLLMQDIPRLVNQCLSITRKQAECGYFMSDKTADKTIGECNKIYKGKGDDLISSFDEKLNSLNLSKNEKEKLIKKNKEYIKKYYLPAYKDIIYMLTDLKGSGKNDGGLCNYGETGKKYYEAIVREKTSSNMSPEELKEMLDDNITKTLTAAVTISPEDAVAAPQYQPDFKTADEIVEFLTEHIEEDFAAPVTKDYNIKYMSKATETDTNSAYYMKCRIDDISVNNIKVNSSVVGSDNLTLYTTLAHESYPGHLYQLTGFFNKKDIPNIQKILDFIGATEGWAQYASKCAVNYLDATDGIKDFINLNSMLSYTLIARVDVGVNYDGWTIDDVYDYLSSYIMVSDDFDSEENVAAQFYDIAIGNAGDYIPYAAGYIKMVNMREHAEDELGDKFNPVEFHSFINSIGVTTFDIYEAELDNWIENKTK